jgi:hypothetical protein
MKTNTWRAFILSCFIVLLSNVLAAQRPTPPKAFSTIVYTYIGDIELVRSTVNYDLARKAERMEAAQHGHVDVSILRYDLKKVFTWVQGTQECRVTDIPEEVNPDIWLWLENAQDKGSYTYFGQKCELWSGVEGQLTTLGCFASDSTPVFLNVTMEEAPLNHLLFINFRPGPQSPSLFQPPSFCPTTL